jgi:hypothetical protein
MKNNKLADWLLIISIMLALTTFVIRTSLQAQGFIP